MDISSSIQLTAALTGLVGTIGGVVISYLTLRHAFRKDKHKINVELSKAIIGSPEIGSPTYKWSKDQMIIKVANIGAKEYTIVSVGMKIGRRSGGLYINQPKGTVSLPYKLQPDETCDFWAEYKDIAGHITKPKLHNSIGIKAYVRDYIGNSFDSNKMTITLKNTWRSKVRAWLAGKWNQLLVLLWP